MCSGGNGLSYSSQMLLGLEEGPLSEMVPGWSGTQAAQPGRHTHSPGQGWGIEEGQRRGRHSGPPLAWVTGCWVWPHSGSAGVGQLDGGAGSPGREVGAGRP